MAGAELDSLLAFAVKLADLAGPIVRRHFRTRAEVFDKPDRTPVTAADRAAETALRAAIARAYPGHGIVGEEHGAERADAEYVWYLDPIDGTKAFIAGIPLFGTLIGLAERGHPLLGIVDHPALGERWVGARGRATTHNDTPVACRPCPTLDQAQLFSTDPDLFLGAEAVAFGRIKAAARRTRFGTDCYAYGLVASGFGDLVVESDLDATDFMALVPVVEGAGGRMRDWRGRPLGPESAGDVLAVGDPRLLEAALALLA